MPCLIRHLLVSVWIMLLAACQHNTPEPMRTAERVDLSKFVGTWYVIGNIPTFLERNVYNAVENYTLTPEGHIDTVFTFNKGAFDGSPGRYTMTGFVRDDNNNAVWDMQPFWPLRAEYRIMYVDPTYTHTVIGRSARDYLWIMARTPHLSDEDYAPLEAIAVEAGYAADAIRRIPHAP